LLCFSHDVIEVSQITKTRLMDAFLHVNLLLRTGLPPFACHETREITMNAKVRPLTAAEIDFVAGGTFKKHDHRKNDHKHDHKKHDHHDHKEKRKDHKNSW
jgi:hypothetical protein